VEGNNLTQERDQ